MVKNPKPFHRVMFDADGVHACGLHTHDPDVAARWLREAPRNAKRAGHMQTPYIVHFEPAHNGWPDAAAVRVLRRLGADCELRSDGVIEVRQASDAVRRAIERLGLDIYTDLGTLIELHAPEGDSHGLDVIRSVHRLHPDIARNADGSIELRNLYHYPDRAADDESQLSAQHALLTKRQWAKVPVVVSKRHAVLTQPEKRK